MPPTYKLLLGKTKLYLYLIATGLLAHSFFNMSAQSKLRVQLRVNRLAIQQPLPMKTPIILEQQLTRLLTQLSLPLLKLLVLP